MLSRIWRILLVEEGAIHRGQGPKVDKTLRNLQNSLYPTKAKFNNNSYCYIIHSKNFLRLLPAISLFVKQHNLVPMFARSMVQ